MKAKRGARRPFNFSRRKEVIEMRVGVQNVRDRETQAPDLFEDPAGFSAGIDDDRLLRNGVPEYRAVAAQWRYRESSADELVHASSQAMNPC